ncbi:uncharacterized protein LOC133197005 [Saccostrea echinata]|uniref:uncharacterized protein LOC133197005 n=1 Tax=Saccostrea echinata TaxID=191078 RepID=UPI002A80ACA8|nr:uncharacterized protein LOC133197005 [Saccostrea echinata]
MSLQFLLSLAVFLVATNAQPEAVAENNQLLHDLYEARTFRRNWQEVTEAFGLKPYKWTTTLPTNTLVNETAYLAESKNILLMKSRDRDLKNEGFDKSTTLIDFETGMIAFRTKFPTTNEIPAAIAGAGEPAEMTRRERRRKLRQFFAGRENACFITNTGVTLADAKRELQNRVTNSPVSTGTAKRFVAEEMNRISTAELTKLNHKIAKFCTKPGKHGNHFRLVADSMATTHKDNLVVMGQFDTTQRTKSVPYEIHIEQSIIDRIQTPLSGTTPEP